MSQKYQAIKNLDILKKNDLIFTKIFELYLSVKITRYSKNISSDKMF